MHEKKGREGSDDGFPATATTGSLEAKKVSKVVFQRAWRSLGKEHGGKKIFFPFISISPTRGGEKLMSRF